MLYYTTHRELEFIDKLGKHRENTGWPFYSNTRRLNRQELIKLYFISAINRENWGEISQEKVLKRCLKEIGEAEAKKILKNNGLLKKYRKIKKNWERL